MIELEWSALPGPLVNPVALTVGVFDGIHKGHRELISRITTAGSLDSVVVTFRRLPAEILSQSQFPGLVMSLTQKLRTLSDLQVDAAVLIDFSRAFSSLSGTGFLERLLVSLNLRLVVLGHDFRCGHNLDTDAPEARSFLESRGVSVEIIDAVSVGEEPVSSTRIRQLILGGELGQAANLLGKPFTLDVSREQIARAGSWQTIDLVRSGTLPVSRQLIPPPGTYDAEFLLSESDTDNTPVAGTVAIVEKSVRWQLPESPKIRYIVLLTRRT